MAALEEILQRHPVWLGGSKAAFSPAVPTGYPSLDQALPGGGWPAAALTEILPTQAGIGELQLVLPSLAALSWAGKRVVWLAPPHLPYAPALAAAGVDLAHLAVVLCMPLEMCWGAPIYHFRALRAACLAFLEAPAHP